MPKVSIIVPNYNHAVYLQQRLETIFKQTYQDYEVILLDDCSTDNSREILESYKNHPKVSNLIFNTINSGTSYKQWDKGIENAAGSLIWIAESDDWCEFDFLEKTIHYFEDHNVVLVFAGTELVYEGFKSENKFFTGNYEIFNGNQFICEKMITMNHIYNASGVLFRKERYLEINKCGFLKMKLCGDWLLWSQMMNNNKIVLLQDVINYCRRHNYNATSKFRALGFDFTEGMEVLRFGKTVCSKNFERKETYFKWLEFYRLLSHEFAKGVKFKVLLFILFKEPFLFAFIIYKNLKKCMKSKLIQYWRTCH